VGTPLELHGSPVELEVYLRRGARLVQLLLALPPTLTLWWWEEWFWVPIPLALSFLLYELLFWSRGDRPTVLQLTDEGLRLADPWREAPVSVRWDEVELAKATWRRVRPGAEVTLLLASARGPRFAARFLMSGGPSPASAWGDLDLEAADKLLGGQGGVVRSVAPFELVARQRFEDPRALALLREKLPADCWHKTGLRLWQGQAPALDAFGYHVDEPSGWLILQDTHWELRKSGTTEVLSRGDIDSLEVWGASRKVSIVLGVAGPVETEVPMLGLGLGTLRIWFPAPTAGPAAPPAAIEPTDQHTHPPEGAALLWHVLAVLPRDRWPPALHEMFTRSGSVPPAQSPSPRYPVGDRKGR
jgi:hypothetical protein